LIGHGMGSFEDKFGFYSHSFYYDVLLFYGYTGLIIISTMLFFSIKKVLSFNFLNKVFAILWFCLWCPKLFFSIYFIKEPALWCFIALGFMSFQLQTGNLPIEQGEKI
jgi:hypothetical protein